MQVSNHLLAEYFKNSYKPVSEFCGNLILCLFNACFHILMTTVSSSLYNERRTNILSLREDISYPNLFLARGLDIAKLLSVCYELQLHYLKQLITLWIFCFAMSVDVIFLKNN